MSTYTADGINLVSQSTQPRSVSQFPWDNYPAVVKSDYEISAGHSLASAAAAAAEAASDSGWDMRPDRTIPNKYLGTKDLSVGEGLLTIVAISADGERENQLRVYVEFAGIYD